MCSNISRPNSRRRRARARCSRYSTTARSRSVVVGELRITVSERIAPSSITAVGRVRLHAALAEALDRPAWRSSRRGRTSRAPGTRVSIEPMWWWSRISTISACSMPTTLCACSAWSTSSTRRGVGLTRSRARDEADRAAVAVDRHGRAVVDVLDGLGDVGQQVVGRDGQRLAVHQRPARRRQRDHAARHVGVERRGDHRGAALAREREDVVVRLGCRCWSPAARRRSRSRSAARPAGRRRRRRRRPRSRSAASRWPSRAPTRGPLTSRVPARRRAARPRAPRRSRRSRSGASQARRLARLADVAAGELALGHHAGELALVVDDGTRSSVLAGHDQADLADRLAVVGDGKRSRITSRTRSMMCGQELAARCAPLRSSTQRVCALSVAEPHGHVLVARVQPALELGVADRRRDRVGVGVAVPGDVDARHVRPAAGSTPGRRTAGTRRRSRTRISARGRATP